MAHTDQTRVEEQKVLRQIAYFSVFRAEGCKIDETTASISTEGLYRFADLVKECAEKHLRARIAELEDRLADKVG